MATEIRVPTLGESITEATVGQWFKKAGEAVNADEPVVELETDKVTIEVPAPAGGVLAGISVGEGETVEVYVDGRTHADKVVVLGLVTLDNDITGANVSIGLPTTWTFKSHRFETGSLLQSSQGKIRRVSQVVVRLLSTLGLQYGPDLDGLLDEEPFDYGTDVNSMTPLFTGDKKLDWPGSHETEGRITMKGTGPFPAQIQSIVPQIEAAPRLR